MNWVVLLLLVGSLCLIVLRVALWRAVVALQQRQHAVAQNWLTVAATLNWLPGCSADRAETLFLQAKIFRRQGALERVAPALRQAHELGFDLAMLQREEAYALVQDGKFEKVGNHWGKLFVEAGSDAPELADAYVTFCLARFRFADAEQVIKSWIADFPTDFRPHRHRGQVQFVLQNWTDSVQALEAAARLAPQDEATRLLKAQAHLKLLQFAEADDELEFVLQHNPHHADALILRATCLSNRGEIERAKHALQDVLKIEPTRFTALRELGLLEAKLGNATAAARLLEQAIKGHEEDAELRHAFAKALTSSGRAEDAAAHFAFMDEASKPLLRLPKLTNQLATEPSNIELRHEIAQSVWKYRSRAEGLLWLKSTLEFAPSHSGTHQLLAEHYLLEGNAALAEQHARAANRP